MGPCPELDERGLIQADGGGAVEPAAVGLQQGGAIGGHRVVDGVPIAIELGGNLGHGPPGADLHRRPLGRPGGQQALLGRDAVIGQDPRLHLAVGIRALHPVLLPPQPHGRAVDRKVDVVHHRALLHVSPAAAGRASNVLDDLLDHQLHVRPGTLVVQHPDVLQRHEGGEDVVRVREDEGVSCFLAHTSSLRHLRPQTG